MHCAISVGGTPKPQQHHNRQETITNQKTMKTRKLHKMAPGRKHKTQKANAEGTK